MNADKSSGQLAALIRTYLEAGESYRRIADRAAKAGFVISHTQVGDYTKGRAVKPPSTEQIKALAAGLPASIAEVNRAVVQDWYGYDPIDSDEYLLAVPADLSPEKKLEAARMVRAWVDANASQSDD